MSKPNPFDTCSEQYSKFRPDYPSELMDTIYKLCNGLLIDVGAGTGKASTPFIARGVPVISVEPSLPMIRAGLRDSSPESGGADATGRKSGSGGVVPFRYVCALAEELPILSAGASVVVCAQAFHWLDAPRALSEFARVLKPGGHFCLFWNTRDEKLAAVQLFENLVQKWNPGHALAYRKSDWGDRILEISPFRSVEHHMYYQTVSMSIDDWIGLSRSVSYVQSIGREKVSHFESDLRKGLSRLNSTECSYIGDLWVAQK